jgi:hypothetical protein
MLSRLDLEADRLGIPRQSLIKIWIGERLAARRQPKSAKSKRRAKTAGAARLTLNVRHGIGLFPGLTPQSPRPGTWTSTIKSAVALR